MKTYILVKHGYNPEGFFPNVTIRDTRELVPVIINGYQSREYKTVAGPMPYLEAFELRRKMLEELTTI